DDLRRRIDREAADAKAQRREEQEAKKGRAGYAAAAAERQRAQWGRTLDVARRTARPLESLWRRRSTKRGERPLRILAATRINDQPLLEYKPPAPAPPLEDQGRAWRVLDRLVDARSPRPGRWRSTIDPAVSFPGTQSLCA